MEKAEETHGFFKNHLEDNGKFTKFAASNQ